MDLNLTPSKQVKMTECKRHINMNSEKTENEGKVEVIHEEKTRTHYYSDQKLEILIHSVQKIEKEFIKITAQFEKFNGQFEKLLTVLTPNNVKGSIQDGDPLKGEDIHSEPFKDDSTNGNGLYSRSLKDDALNNRSEEIDLPSGSLKDGGLENKSHKEERLSAVSMKEETVSRITNSSFSPFINCDPDYSSPSLQPMDKRKIEVNSEDNIKTDMHGLSKILTEVFNFQFCHHRFPSQLVTMKDTPMITKIGPKMSNGPKVSSKSKDSQHKKSVRCSTVRSEFTDNSKSKDMTSKKRARTYEVNTMKKFKKAHDNREKSKVERVEINKVEKENKICNFEIEPELQDLFAQAQIKCKTKKDKYDTGDLLSENFKETSMITDAYKQYLKYLTPEERTICLNVDTWKNPSNILYIAKNNFLDVANARTVFPKKWLSDWVL